MKKEILIDKGCHEIRAAILEDGEPAEIYYETTGREKRVGNIYRGVIEKVLPGMQAAFVNIGTEKNAYLYADDALSAHVGEGENRLSVGPIKIETLMKPGQTVMVQVVKEPIGSKGARVTQQVTLPGRYVILSPCNEEIGVSRKIKNPEERERLKKLASALCPEGMGLVVRTASENSESEAIEKDICFLKGLWDHIVKQNDRGLPACVYQEPGLIQKLVRDYLYQGVHRIVLNDDEEYRKLLSLADKTSTGIKTRVEFHSGDYDLFAFFNIEAAINRAMSRKVWLKCGGYIVFDKTEALTVIDVNTGKFTGKDNQEETILKTNLEAARCIAGQIRLRNISGIILIDFIDMNAASHQEEVLAALSEAVKKDRSKVFILGMTNLGLVEMTRRKRDNELHQNLTVPCPLCRGDGRIMSPQAAAGKVLRTLKEVLRHTGSSEIEAKIHPEVYGVLTGQWKECVDEMGRFYQKKITLAVSAELNDDSISIEER